MLETGAEEAEKLVERIKDKCNLEKEDPIKPSVSLGYSTKEYLSQDINEVYKTAEDRMYNIKLMESRSIRSSIISSLRKALHERTHETEEHSERLIKSAYQLGKALRLSMDRIHNLQLLTLLHDIGITAMPDNLLHSNDNLTAEEWEIIKTHCEIGYRIVSTSQDLAHIAEDILCHHENWDGSGYPQGLAGEAIPLNARILSIIDAYDSMVYGNFHQNPATKEDTIKYLKDQAGKRFDPKITETFIKIINQ